MDKRTRKLSEEPFLIGEPNEVLTVEVAYEEGGANWFHGTTSARGYFIRVIPTRITPDGCRQITLGEGCKALIEPAKRFSEKRMDAAMPSDEIIAKLIEKVTADRLAKKERYAKERAVYDAAKAAKAAGG